VSHSRKNISQHVQTLKVSFEKKTIQLYSQILEYQIRLARQCSRSSAVRILRDLAIVDDWQVLLAGVKKTVDNIEPFLRILDGNKLSESNKQINELVDSQMKIQTGVEVSFPFKMSRR